MKINKVSKYILLEILSKAVPFILLPIYLYYFSVESYGILSLYSIFVSSFIPIIGLGLNSLIIADYNLKKNIVKRLIVVIYVSLLVLFIVTALIYLIQLWIGDFRGANFIIYAPFIALLHLFLIIFKDLLLHSENQATAATINFIQLTLVNIFTFSFFLISDKEDELWFYRVLAELFILPLILVLSVFFISRLGLFNHNRGCKVELIGFVFFRESIRESVHLIPNMFFKWFRLLIERKYVLLFIGTSALGNISIAYQIMSMPLMILGLLLNYFNPYLIDQVKNNQISGLIYKIIAFVVAIQAASVLFLILFGEPLMRIYLGEKYNNEILILCSIQFIGGVFLFFSTLIRMLPYYSGKSRASANYINIFYLIHPMIIFIFSGDSVIRVTIASAFSMFIVFLFSLRFYQREVTP